MTPGRDIAGVFGRAAPSYGHIGQDIFEHFGRRLVAMIGPPLGRAVLDVGCGTGATLLAASDAAGGESLAVGADLSRDMLLRLRTTSVDHHQPVVCALADAQRLPFRDGVFDTVASSFALSYFPSPEQAAAEFRRVLLPGGTIGICVSDGWWFQGDPEWRWHEELLDELGAFLGHGRFRDPGAVADLLTAAGFRLDDVVVEPFALRWADVDEWWDHGWSHGYREVLEALSPSALHEYRRRSEARLRGRPVRGRLEVVLATGSAPG